MRNTGYQSCYPHLQQVFRLLLADGHMPSGNCQGCPVLCNQTSGYCTPLKDHLMTLQETAVSSSRISAKIQQIIFFPTKMQFGRNVWMSSHYFWILLLQYTHYCALIDVKHTMKHTSCGFKSVGVIYIFFFV